MGQPVASVVLPSAERSRSWGSSWPLIIAAATFFLFDNAGRLVDPDTYLHLAAGQWMLQHFAVPDTDPFSQPMRGAPWVAHEWLAEIVLALMYRLGGWAGIVALTAAAFAATAALLAHFLLKYLRPLHVVAAVTLAELCALPHLVARPHVLAMPLMVLWMGGLVDAASAGRAPRWLLLPVMALWANLHGGFTLGLGLAGLFAIEAVIEAPDRGEAIARALSWGRFLLLALAASCVSPHPIEGLRFAAGLAGLDYSLGIIGEWRSPDFHLFQPLELWLLLALALALSLGLRLPPVRLLILLGLLHLGLRYARSGELIGLLAPLAVAAPLARQLPRTPSSSALDRAVDALARPASRSVIAGGIAALAVAALVIGHDSSPRFDPAVTPDRAVAASREAGLDGPVFNAYVFGGYLIFAGIPPLIDGRVDLYGDAFVHEVGDAMTLASSAALPEFLDRHGIEWTLLQPGTPAVALLDHLTGWRRLYGDEVAVIHVRTTAPGS